MATHLHHYKDGICADPRAIGGPCGEPQRYSPPTGKGYEFTDELIPGALVPAVFRLAAGGYEGSAQQQQDSENVLEWVVPLLD